MKNHKVWELFRTFLKIGAFTFGGGIAMIPLIKGEVVEKKQWLSDQDILDMVAMAEMTPGPVAINVATFVGYQVAGFVGACAATLGVIIPSFFIILLISYVFQPFMHHPIVENAFWGIRIGVLALIVKAFITMFKACPKNAVAYGMGVVALVLVAIFDVNVILIIFLAAVVGVIYNSIRVRKEKKP